jgi:hypothetical protein
MHTATTDDTTCASCNTSFPTSNCLGHTLPEPAWPCYKGMNSFVVGQQLLSPSIYPLDKPSDGAEPLRISRSQLLFDCQAVHLLFHQPQINSFKDCDGQVNCKRQPWPVQKECRADGSSSSSRLSSSAAVHPTL